jgi:hypothetical protein
MSIKIQTILVLGLGVLIGYFIGSNAKKNSYDDYIMSTMYYKGCVNKQAPQVAEYCGNETIKAYPQAF